MVDFSNKSRSLMRARLKTMIWAYDFRHVITLDFSWQVLSLFMTTHPYPTENNSLPETRKHIFLVRMNVKFCI